MPCSRDRAGGVAWVFEGGRAHRGARWPLITALGVAPTPRAHRYGTEAPRGSSRVPLKLSTDPMCRRVWTEVGRRASIICRGDGHEMTDRDEDRELIAV